MFDLNFKKAISPVVATALLLVVAVISVVGFQGWFESFSSGIFVDVESDSSGGDFNVGVEDLVGNILYINAGDNLSINSLSIGSVDCNINGSYSGLSKINVSSCIENLSSVTVEVMIVAGDRIIGGYEYVDLVSGGADNLISPNLCEVNVGAGFFNGSGSLIDPYQICDCTQLQNMKNYLSADFVLINDISCLNFNSGSGLFDNFIPIGANGTDFSGTLDGLGNTISDLMINTFSNSRVGLFAGGLNSKVMNLTLNNVDIIPKHFSSNFTKSEDIAGVGNTIITVYGWLEPGLKSWSLDGDNEFVYGDGSDLTAVGNLERKKAVAISNDVAYIVSSYDNDFNAWDISDPNNLVLLGENRGTKFLGVSDIFILGDVAYIVSPSYNELSTYNISDPTNITFLGNYTSPVNLIQPISVYVDSGVAYVGGASNAGFTTLDVSDPSNILFLDWTNTNMNVVNGINYNSGVVYVLNRGISTLSALNVSNPSSIQPLDSLRYNNMFVGENLEIYNDVAYVTDVGTIYSLDVSNPNSIVLLDNVNVSVIGNDGLYIYNNILYNLNGNQAIISAWDISNSSDLKLLSHTSAGSSSVGSIFGQGTYIDIDNVGVINVDIGGYDTVGGLVGYSYNSQISNSYSTGDVVGSRNVGGLVGSASYGGQIANTYSMGDVVGNGQVGGLVGYVATDITNSYSVGSVTGVSSVGGLAGYFYKGNISNSYWDTDVAGVPDNGQGVGINTLGLQTPTSNSGIYSTWDLLVWNFGDSNSYPTLFFE